MNSGDHNTTAAADPVARIRGRISRGIATVLKDEQELGTTTEIIVTETVMALGAVLGMLATTMHDDHNRAQATLYGLIDGVHRAGLTQIHTMEATKAE